MFIRNTKMYIGSHIWPLSLPQYLLTFQFWITFHVNWGQILTRYGLICGLDEWFWVMFEPTPTWFNFDFGQLFMWIGANKTRLRIEAWFWEMFEPTPTRPEFTFGQLVRWIGANNGQICLPRGEMSDFEQCSNRLQLDLLLVNFWYKLGKIMTRYVFLEQLTYFYFWSTYDFRQVMTRYDC